VQFFEPVHGYREPPNQVSHLEDHTVDRKLVEKDTGSSPHGITQPEILIESGPKLKNVETLVW